MDFVKRTVADRRGELWGWEGDGGLCAFPAGSRGERATQALDAALKILRGVSPFDLSREPFPGAKTQLRVRIAAHLGTANVRKHLGKVHSADINFVAHLEKRATANSIIISDATLRECRDRTIRGLF